MRCSVVGERRRRQSRAVHRRGEPAKYILEGLCIPVICYQRFMLLNISILSKHNATLRRLLVNICLASGAEVYN